MRHQLSLLLFILTGLLSSSLVAQTDSIPPLKDGKSPQTIEEIWAGFDPRAEPLDVQVIKEWEEDGVILKALRYRIGIFKGQKSWMGALYGFPKGAQKIPGIVQIHGGGGMANKKPCIENAKRGYATISLSWRADERYLKEYQLPATAQTDWGAVEGRQVNGTRDVKSTSDEHYDPVDSARNHGYFLRTLAARRALTFLEQQPEVDAKRLGVDGYSMGGVITFMTAATDHRVKAAAPWWAPPIRLDDSLLGRTATTNAYAKHMKGSMLIMAPTNDFHGKAEDVAWMIDHIPSKDLRIARSAHLNHKNDQQSMAARELWLDAKLKDGFSFPAPPQIFVKLDTKDGRPQVSVRPDTSMPISHIDVFFTRDGNKSSSQTMRTRYWQFAKPTQENSTYTASLDIFDQDEPLWIFANVYYQLEDSGKKRALTKAAKTFTVSTRLIQFSSKQLAQANIKKVDKKTSIIESFQPDWEKEWVITGNKLDSWKLNHARILAHDYSKLVLELQSDDANHLILQFGDYQGIFKIKSATDTQRIEIFPFDLEHKKTKNKLLSWSSVERPQITLATSRSKSPPNYKLLAWEKSSKETFMAKRPFQLGSAPKKDDKVMLTFSLADLVDGRHDPDRRSVKVDKSISNIDISNGLQVHAQNTSEVTYFLNGKFKTFSATLVPCYQASVTFEVHADGKRIYQSKRFTGKTPPEAIKVNITGVKMLKLVVTEGGNSWPGDWVLWGAASVK